MLARFAFSIIFSALLIIGSNAQVSIIPEPVSLQQKEGAYSFKNGVAIASDAGSKKVADWLKEKLNITGLPVSVVSAGQKADITFSSGHSMLPHWSAWADFLFQYAIPGHLLNEDEANYIYTQPCHQ